MPQFDYKLLVHGTTSFSTGALIGASGAQISENVLDMGYTAAANLGALGTWGLHVQVMASFTDITSARVAALSGSTNAPATTIGERVLYLAQLTAGKHYFVPCSPPIQEYLAAYWTPTGTSATAGKVLMWFGPGKDGSK